MYTRLSSALQCRVVFRVALIALPVCGIAWAAEPAVPTRGEPSPEFLELLSPALKQELGLALIEMAMGDQSLAEARAQAAVAPERLAIYFDTTGYSGKRSEELKSWSRRSIQDWNASSHTAPFIEVSSKAAADVVVVFAERVRGVRGRYAGYTSWKRTVRMTQSGHRCTVNARIEISNRTQNGRLMKRGQVIKVLSHELGHVLGLGDNGDSSSLMGPLSAGSSQPEIGERERRALMELDYRARAVIASAQPAVRSNAPQIFKFSEPR